MIDSDELKRLAGLVTPGEWSEDDLKSDGAYGSGDDTHEGFTTTAIYDAKGNVLFDALNSDAILVHEEWDEDGFCHAYDLTSAANAALICVLRNNLPTIIAALETAALVRDEDWLEDRISDSLDLDWRPIDAARAIIAALPKETDNAHD